MTALYVVITATALVVLLRRWGKRYFTNDLLKTLHPGDTVQFKFGSLEFWGVVVENNTAKKEIVVNYNGSLMLINYTQIIKYERSFFNGSN
jgi:hypothetical protein